jgi:YidC/Oxa1 family membrane protein insertase
MNNVRMLLWFALLFVVWLNVDAWMKDREAAARAAAPVATAPAAPGATGPAIAAGGLADALPTVGAPATPAAAAEPQGASAPATSQASTVHVHTDVLDLDISLEGGSLVRAELPEYPLHKNDPGTPVRLFDASSADTLYVYQSGLTTGQAGRAEPNHKAVFTAPAREFRLAEGADELRVPLTWTDGAGLTVGKTYVFRRGSYVVDLTYDVNNATGEPLPFAQYSQLLRHSIPVKRSMFDVESYAFRGPAVYDGQSYQKLAIDDEDDRRFDRAITGGWAAAMQHHFVSAIVPPAGEAYQYTLRVDGQDYLFRTVGPAKAVQPGTPATFAERLFVGPKLQAQLEEAGPRLELTADYGKLTILAQPLFWLLDKVYGLVGNWGWAIVIVTLLIKLVFYKLSETSGRSMAKMRTVAPRLKAIQERYKDDREGQARAMMELYKREKINPVAGCLPMLVQIPFFLAFYWVLLESVEMRQAPFMGWIQDLSTRDPFFILPLLMGAAMYGQFKLNPAPPDPVQAKVFAFMPVIMTVMFAWFPAGLVLYWLTNTLLSIAQQWKINRVVEAEAKKERTQ